jgi:hypothetical protein
MDYVRLGKTGLKVSRLCLGCMTYGTPEKGSHSWALNEHKAGHSSGHSRSHTRSRRLNFRAGSQARAVATPQVIAPKLPRQEELATELGKLEAFPSSIVLIAIESFPNSTDCRVTWGWFSAAERKMLRAALERARERREAARRKKKFGIQIPIIIRRYQKSYA